MTGNPGDPSSPPAASRSSHCEFSKPIGRKTRPQDPARTRWEEPEEYRWDPEEFGADAVDDGEPWNDEREDDTRVSAFDFLGALASQQMGNHDYTLTPGDLSSLEGGLNLASYGIGDLTGLEHCLNLTRLDLSDNRLENLYELSFLGYLRELYLNQNVIEDLGPLAALTALEILDVRDNEIEDFSPSSPCRS